MSHHPRGFPIAGEHHVGSRRAAAVERGCQADPSGVGGYAALEAGGLGLCYRGEIPHFIAIAYSFSCNRTLIVSLVRN